MRITEYMTRHSGFTLIEVLVTLLISSIIIGSIFTVYSVQQKSYTASDQTAGLQQNLRAAILIMTKEIREAGCDPTGYAHSGFVAANVGQLEFTRDIAGHAVSTNQSDGDTDDANEDIIFGFSPADDTDSNGIVDGGDADWRAVADLKRDSGAGFQPIAERMAAIEFNYILEDDTTTTSPAASELKKIKAVQISLLTKASSPDSKLSNLTTYTTASGATWGPFNDNYRRRFVSTTVYCRNLGY